MTYIEKWVRDGFADDFERQRDHLERGVYFYKSVRESDKW